MHVPPPVLGVAAALAQRLLSRDARPATPLRTTVAAVTGLSSAALSVAAAAQFRHWGTTVDPTHPDRASVLVTTGPNAATRNPMYVGLAGLLVAHAIRRGSWLALIPVAGFVAVIDWLQIPAEEAALSARFGAEYDAYRTAVPRWLDPRSLDLGGL